MPTILLVDDVELFLELEKSYLQDRGYKLVTARSGEEALELLAEVQPELVLLDLFMPGMDGDEVCREIRASEAWPELPIIMVTAAGRDSEIRRCLEAGCDDYLTKPVSKVALLEKVQRLLGEVKSRLAPRTPVSLRVNLQGQGKSLAATARDISNSGIYVRSRSTLEVGSVVEVQLEFPGGEEVQVLGKVKRVQEGAEEGMGIYFIRPEAEGLATLDQFLGGKGVPSAKAGVTGEVLQKKMGRIERQLQEVEEENQALKQRIEELEGENREFARQIVTIEEVNNTLTNLYVASSKLHSVLNRDQVIEIIKEVVINFVGAEKFALLLLGKDSQQLRFAAGEGFSAEDIPPVVVGEGLLGEVLAGGESYLQDGPVGDGSDDPAQPVAAIPLKIHGEIMGILAVYRLLVQKERFAPIDYQLFSMMAEHAATALFSANLYGESERKRETYRGMMDLLLK